MEELDIWGNPVGMKWGDRVRLRKTGEEGIIDRLGTFPKVFRIAPALGGEFWHTEDELEKINDH